MKGMNPEDINTLRRVLKAHQKDVLIIDSLIGDLVARKGLISDEITYIVKIIHEDELMKKPKLTTVDRINRIVNKLYSEVGIVDDDSLHVMVNKLEECLNINKNDGI